MSSTRFLNCKHFKARIPEWKTDSFRMDIIKTQRVDVAKVYLAAWWPLTSRGQQIPISIPPVLEAEKELW